MKKTTILILLLAVGFTCTLTAFKKQESGQVIFMRSTNNVGSIIAYKVYIDDSLVCHLKNNRYSSHTIAPGEHTVSIQNAGLAKHSISRPFKITVAAGKPNYLVAINGPELYLQEVVESSALDLMKRLAATESCLPAKKD